MRFLYKLHYRLYRWVSWGRFWGQRHFTHAGLTLVAGLIVAITMAPDTENNVTYQALAPLFCLLAVAIVASWFFRGRFSATRVLPRFGTVGTPVTYTVALRNLAGRPQIGLTLFDDPTDPRPPFDEWYAVQRAEEKHSFRFARRRGYPFRLAKVQAVPLPPLAPRQSTEVQIQLTPLRRGSLALAGLTVARPDPLGLFRAVVKLPLPQSLLVLPKRYPVPLVPLPGTLKYQQGGVALASNVGQSEEFVALRDYRHGDPLRHIHWRSWARTDKPVVKEFEDEFFVRHALVLDTFTNDPRSECFEDAISIAASFACTVQTQESLLDLLFVGPKSYCFTAGRGLGGADRMLEVLASVGACREHPFGVLEHLVLSHVQVVSGCICVLLDWDETRRRFIEKLKALGVPLLVLVVAAPGKAALDPGPMRDQPGQFRVLEAGSIEQGLAKIV